MQKGRLDGCLVEHGLVSSRSQAQQLIKEGAVLVNGTAVTKSSFKVSHQDNVTLTKDKLWVGRGAEKMAGAFDDFNFSFEGRVVGDMGASTGGFVQFALHHGAKKVYAVDVGTNQLARELIEDKRVINLEGTNIKEGLTIDEKCDLVVVDLSFISLELVLRPIISCLRPKGDLVVLVKPQFEVGKQSIGKKGIVKDSAAVLTALEKVFGLLKSLGCPVIDVSPCRIKGKTGNQEYFFHCIYDETLSGYSQAALAQLVS